MFFLLLFFFLFLFLLFSFFLFFFTSPIQIIIFKNKSKTTSNNPNLQNSPQNSRNCKGTLLHRNWRQEQLAVRVPTRHRHWRRVGSRAAKKAAGRNWLLPLFSSATVVTPTVTCKTKKTQNTTTSRPFSSRFFFHLHPTDPVFWTLISTLFQVAGKEEDTDQRGITAGGVRSDCGYCCCRWGLFGRW